MAFGRSKQTGQKPVQQSARKPAARPAQQRPTQQRPVQGRPAGRPGQQRPGQAAPQQRRPQTQRRIPSPGTVIRNGRNLIRHNEDGTVTHMVKKKERIFGVRGGVDLPFLLAVFVLVIIGLIMMFSASYFYAYQNQGSSVYYVTRQGIFAVIGLIIMFVISFLDYHVLHRLSIPILVVTWIFLIAARVLPGVAGVHRWINLGIVSFQPSEIAKFAIILWFSHFISIHFDKMKYFKSGILPNLLVLGLTALLVIIEPHFSATIIILLLAGMMLFIGGAQKRWFAIAGIILAAGVLFLLLFTNSYFVDRVSGWLNVLDFESSEQWQSTWQTRNSLYAIGSGGFFGLGLGQSHQKYLWLPEPQNDFVFAVVCEELGFVGAVLIILLFAFLVWRGIRIGLRAKDKFGMLMAVGLVLQIGLQVALNIGVVTNTLPNTGISLPFFSYGGTSLIILLAQMGFVLSISRTASVRKV